jgi:hypothetical protein
MPSVHKTGMGCQKCGKNHRPSNDEFIEKAKELHGDTYDYSFVVYVNQFTPVNILCKIHGMFQQRPDCQINNSIKNLQKKIRIKYSHSKYLK